MIAHPPCDAPISAIRPGSTNGIRRASSIGDQHVAGPLRAHEDLPGADQPPDLVLREPARPVAVHHHRRPALPFSRSAQRSTLSRGPSQPEKRSAVGNGPSPAGFITR